MTDRDHAGGPSGVPSGYGADPARLPIPPRTDKKWRIIRTAIVLAVGLIAAAAVLITGGCTNTTAPNNNAAVAAPTTASSETFGASETPSTTNNSQTLGASETPSTTNNSEALGASETPSTTNDSETLGASQTTSNATASEAVNDGSRLKIRSGEFEHADSYLADVESQWRSGLAQGVSADILVSPEAHCYYVLDGPGGTFAGVLACGPVHRRGMEDGHVWDTYRADAEVAVAVPGEPTSTYPADEVPALPPGNETASDNTETAPSYSPEQRTPVLLPATEGKPDQTRPVGVLFRPDGSQPAKDADKLPGPANPKAAADLFVKVDPTGIQTDHPVTIDPQKATLYTPAATIAITKVGTAPSYTDEGGKTFDAAAGHHLLLVTLGVERAWLEQEGKIASVMGVSDLPEARFTLVRGTGRVDISDTLEENGSFLISVKDKEAAKIAVNTGGREQSIIVDTADASKDASSALFAKKRSFAVNATMPPFEQAVGQYGDKIIYKASVSTVTFSPFSPAKGWSPAGKMWVLVVASDASDGGYPYGVGEIDYQNGWVLKTAGGVIKPSFVTLTGRTAGVLGYQIRISDTKVTGSFVSSFVLTANGEADRKMTTKPLTFAAAVGD